MPDLLANLNPEQLQAVTLPNIPALILAGAGSGKTRVLTTRIAWLIQTGQVSPAGVLGVTFTNKAAKEMMARLSAMLPINTRGMWLGTFHGLCNRMLRAHFHDAGLPQSFQILDTGDQLSALKRLLKSLNVDDEKYPAKNLMYFINSAKEQGLRPGAVEANDEYNRKFVELYGLYQEQCQCEGVVDFAELLLRCYELLAHNPPIREHYQQRFRHILVDEFQDTNPLQYAWLKLLSGYGVVPEDQVSAVFAVGDDDQSIYAFRGADVENMRQFERQYKPFLVKLEQNYRSHGHILDAANLLISNNTQRLGKELRTDAGHGEPLRAYEAASDGLEAAWIIDEIQGLIGQGRLRREMAILYRSNAQSRVIEHALFSAGIPYRVYGGLRFFERAEIKHALAYLRLMDNPGDDTAFLRVVNFPARGIGAKSLETLQDLARQHGCSLYSGGGFVPGKTGVNLGAFVSLIERLRFETAQMNLPETVEHVVKHSGLIDHFLKERENLQELTNAASAFLSEEGFHFDQPAWRIAAVPEHSRAAVDASAIAQAAAAVQAGEAQSVQGAQGALELAATVVEPGPVEMSPLSAFLSHASLEAGDNQAQAGQDAVQMMTVHAAKGLEFHAVFITGLEQGLFPNENSMLEADNLEEERRLMYVAITRARERLYLSFAQTRMLHGQTRYNMKSQFFDELPDGAVKWLTPKGGKKAGYGSGYGAGGWSSGYTPAQVVSESPALESRQSEGARFRVGQRVFHSKFGEGTVVGLEGSGDDARAHINFGRHGLKWLALAVAKLTPI
ncbi:MAG: UvrD-helicase domain-containing protein [Candidatus Protistobacter heckmanni]|nr:UvrD-helicase domain-containing protein [Candidatus Protistobacter heckmanni]